MGRAVWISARMSPGTTLSPTAFFHLATAPCGGESRLREPQPPRVWLRHAALHCGHAARRRGAERSARATGARLGHRGRQRRHRHDLVRRHCAARGSAWQLASEARSIGARSAARARSRRSCVVRRRRKARQRWARTASGGESADGGRVSQVARRKRAAARGAHAGAVRQRRGPSRCTCGARRRRQAACFAWSLGQGSF